MKKAIKANITKLYHVTFTVKTTYTVPVGKIGRFFGAKPVNLPIRIPVQARIRMTVGHAGQMRFYLNLLSEQAGNIIKDLKIEELMSGV